MASKQCQNNIPNSWLMPLKTPRIPLIIFAKPPLSAFISRGITITATTRAKNNPRAMERICLPSVLLLRPRRAKLLYWLFILLKGINSSALKPSNKARLLVLPRICTPVAHTIQYTALPNNKRARHAARPLLFHRQKLMPVSITIASQNQPTREICIPFFSRYRATAPQ